jgi:calmodulin
MEKSPASSATFCFELVLQEPCGGLLFILTWCVSWIQSFHPSRNPCQSLCTRSPSNKATLAPARTDEQVVETGDTKLQDDEMGLTHEDVEVVVRSIGLSFDRESSVAGDATGSEYCMHRLFDEDEPSLHEVRQAFLVFDENEDGYLDASDLQRVFQRLGLGRGVVGLGECEKAIATYDVDKDMRIDFAEFTKVLEASIC